MRRVVGLQRDDLERGRWVTPRRDCAGEQRVSCRIFGVLRDRLPGYLLGIRVLATAEVTLCEDEFRAGAKRIPLHALLLQTHGLCPLPRAARQLAARRYNQQICTIKNLGTRDAVLRSQPVELAHLHPRQADVAAT